ncbi:hypothetical protein QEH56_08770 [Pelagicoccus enzymogenes]|uniref:hypothetical protein n=1 Tax=Pelagicoccus enzymogenes TaxID=2773457 RepID=UPI00280EAB49|nr:hypothetical protein [Pelagicoccus enzymogenes]MDQ8198236.1 hypothetical protein [Pelagicoccus enzymogenes]
MKAKTLLSFGAVCLLHGATTNGQAIEATDKAATYQNLSQDELLNRIGEISESLQYPKTVDIPNLLREIVAINDQIVSNSKETLRKGESDKVEKLAKKIAQSIDKVLHSEVNQEVQLKKIRKGLKQLNSVFQEPPSILRRKNHGLRYPRRR